MTRRWPWPGAVEPGQALVGGGVGSDVETVGAPGRDLGPSHFLVTFDDGYADTFEVARPVLRALGIPGIVFLISPSASMKSPYRPRWRNCAAKRSCWASGT
jgi:peptidoglycan/xylan/chitin deacetylase (PgdA/CDA1 family)